MIGLWTNSKKTPHRVRAHSRAPLPERLERLISWFALMIMAVVVVIGCSRISPPRNPSSPSVSLTVSAAASLQDAMKAVQAIYQKDHPTVTLTYNFASSGSLQQQIEQGAPVDVFFSASPKQMDALEKKGLLLPGSRRNLLKNSIVLIIPQGKSGIATFEDLKKEAVKNLSIGEPSSVPAGQYGKEVLESLGLWQSVQPKIVFAKDVRQVLSYVEMANVDAGIVYQTDAKVSKQITIVAVAPESSHSPIIYPVAVIAESKQAKIAEEFVNFLASEAAIASFTRYGFLPAS